MKLVVVVVIISLLQNQNVLSELDTSWWKHTTIYEIFVWSFKDSDGDGIGDLKGITQMLDHFVDLGIETIYVTPFYQSPMIDMGYDVANFTEIDGRFGSMKDLQELLSEMKKRGLKLIIDLVINHSSLAHSWFVNSVDRVNPYTEYYIWRDAKGFDIDGRPIPPNNWMSIFEGSGWEWNDKRRQFYFHQFGKYQSDLNLRNYAVQKEIKNILKFWLEKGVSGFRLDATKHYIEDTEFRDEPPVNPKVNEIRGYNDLRHIYTTDLWESYEFIHNVIKKTVDEFSRRENDFERILVAEVYTNLNHTLVYYGRKDYRVVNFPFNFNFVNMRIFENAYQFRNRMHDWLDNMPKGAVANWASENHDNVRIGSSIDEEFMDIIVIVSMMAPGVACLYYGQEIGMINNQIRDDQKQDIGGAGNFVRDGSRLPMQWDGSLNAGFSSNYQTWLPVHPNYWTVNVQVQKNTEVSRYNLVKNLSEIRKTKTLKHGSFKSYVLSTWVFAFIRTYKRSYNSFITVINLGTDTEIVDLYATIPKLSPVLEIVASSINSGYLKGSRVKSVPEFRGKIFSMKPQSSLVLKTCS